MLYNGLLNYPTSFLSQIMLLTDPEVESSLLISLDEGASYQKYSLGFDILSLLFHPEQEDWILAYSHDQKVMCRCLITFGMNEPEPNLKMCEKNILVKNTQGNTEEIGPLMYYS